MWHAKNTPHNAQHCRLVRPVYRALQFGFEQLDARRCLSIDVSLDAMTSDNIPSDLDQMAQIIQLDDISSELGYVDGLDRQSTDTGLDPHVPQVAPSDNLLGPLIPSAGGLNSSEHGKNLALDSDFVGTSDTQWLEYWKSLAVAFGNYSNAGKLAGEFRNSPANYFGITSNPNNNLLPSVHSPIRLDNAQAVGVINPASSPQAASGDRTGHVAPVPVLAFPRIEIAKANIRAQLTDISSPTAGRSVIATGHRELAPATHNRALESITINATPIHFRNRVSAPSLLERQSADFRQARIESGSEVVSIPSHKINAARVRVLTIERPASRSAVREQTIPVRSAVLPTHNKPLFLRPAKVISQGNAGNAPGNQPTLPAMQPIDSSAAIGNHDWSREVAGQSLPNDSSIQTGSISIAQNSVRDEPMSQEQVDSSTKGYPASKFASLAILAPWLVSAIKKRRLFPAKPAA